MGYYRYLKYKGRLSLRQYRAFLWNYFFIFLPVSGIVLVAILWLGSRAQKGWISQLDEDDWVVLTIAYALCCGLPFFNTTVRRLHDLGLRARDVLFILSRSKKKNIGRDILFKPGMEDSNEYGTNPGRYES